MAPAHMAQGSRVTVSVQSARNCSRGTRAAALQGQHLGMQGRHCAGLGPVARRRQHHAGGIGHHRAHRDFPPRGGMSGFVKGKVHRRHQDKVCLGVSGAV